MFNIVHVSVFQTYKEKKVVCLLYFQTFHDKKNLEQHSKCRSIEEAISKHNQCHVFFSVFKLFWLRVVIWSCFTKWQIFRSVPRNFDNTKPLGHAFQRTQKVKILKLIFWYLLSSRGEDLPVYTSKLFRRSKKCYVQTQKLLGVFVLR